MTITATLKGRRSLQTRIVRCSFDALPVPERTLPLLHARTSTSTSNPVLNKTDFTMPKGTTVQMSVSGTTSTPPPWSTARFRCGPVDNSGLVSMVGSTTTLICKVDGKELHLYRPVAADNGFRFLLTRKMRSAVHGGWHLSQVNRFSLLSLHTGQGENKFRAPPRAGWGSSRISPPWPSIARRVMGQARRFPFRTVALTAHHKGA